MGLDNAEQFSLLWGVSEHTSLGQFERIQKDFGFPQSLGGPPNSHICFDYFLSIFTLPSHGQAV